MKKLVILLFIFPKLSFGQDSSLKMIYIKDFKEGQYKTLEDFVNKNVTDSIG